MRAGRGVFALVACGVLVAHVASCSLGTGGGEVKGTLDIADCWSGAFNLQPDFYAAIPYRSEVIFRVQNGGDYEAFSDGITVLVDDVSSIRANSLGKALDVSLPPGVVPPGTPIIADPNPAPVHLSLYMQHACRLETPALYALRDVALNADGSCGGTANPQTCSDGGASTSAATGHSTITFTDLFDGDPDEGDVAKRRTAATFDVYLADPREACAASNVPPRCRGHLTGSFDFLFQRGRPSQPFP